MEALKSELLKADRIDRCVILSDEKDGELKAYLSNKFHYNNETKKYERTFFVNFIDTQEKRSWWSKQPLATFLENHPNAEVVKPAEKVEMIELDNMALVIESQIDIDEHWPEDEDEDDYGRPLGRGYGTSSVSVEEEDFYAYIELDVAARFSYDPGDYWTPPSDDSEITSVKLSLIEACRYNEDGDDFPLKDEEMKKLEELLKKEIEF